MKCKLTKLKRPDIPGGLRTDDVVGIADYEPEVGKRFCIFADPLEGGFARFIETNVLSVIEKKDESTWQFSTASGSLYKLEKLS